jgi:hypothetical protein
MKLLCENLLALPHPCPLFLHTMGTADSIAPDRYIHPTQMGKIFQAVVREKAAIPDKTSS